MIFEPYFLLFIQPSPFAVDLLTSLDEYVSTLSTPTRVVRTGAREGLIRARLLGAKHARGHVLVFLDAHVEASEGWLVPLLAEIAGDRTRVVMPVIDDLDAETFAYDPVENERARGGLDGKLLHFWMEPRAMVEGQRETDAFPTPTMIGEYLAGFGIE